MGIVFLASLFFSTSFMILRPLGVSFLHRGNVNGKVCYDDTLVLGDWILVGKTVYFKNKQDISKLPSAVL